MLEYLTVAQDKVEIHRYSMLEGDTALTEYRDGDSVEISSVGLTIPVKDVYVDVAGKLFNA